MSEAVSADWTARLQNVVAFDLGDHTMAVPTDILREILEPTTLTRVPCADDYASAMMNVRGVVIPVADLRPVLGIAQKPKDSESRILVLEIPFADNTMLVGLVVDRVNAVIAVDLKTLQPVPDVGPKWPARSMRSVARWNGAFLYLPDVETLFANRIQDKASQVAVEGAEE